MILAHGPVHVCFGPNLLGWWPGSESCSAWELEEFMKLAKRANPLLGKKNMQFHTICSSEHLRGVR